MKALSLTEPMAWAIFHGKDVENRRWPTKVRGRVYIHASKGFDKHHYNFIALEGVACLLDEPLPEPGEFVHGAIIGEVDLTGCEFYPPDDLPRLHSAWAMPGQHQFLLANPVEYEKQIPCRGMLGFFEPKCFCRVTGNVVDIMDFTQLQACVRCEEDGCGYMKSIFEGTVERRPGVITGKRVRGYHKRSWEMQVDDKPSGAVFTDERTHRLYLWRRWRKEGPWVMFIGLNPSTADERLNDPTVRRCIGFALKWGYGGMFMCNVFTLVSTDPRGLNTETPIATGAGLAMRVIRDRCSEAVAGWGNLIMRVREGEERVKRIKLDLTPLHCLGMTKQGHPRHPLYLPYSAELRLLE